jgi:hypothetical protein
MRQTLYNLADKAADYQARDRLSVGEAHSGGAATLITAD